MKKLIFIASFILFALNGTAQVITYANTLTPEQLVNQILLGQGVTASNITFNGSAANAMAVQPNALDYTATGFPFTNGVYLRTQNGGSVAFDPDLNAISTNTITNGAILEFDFIPTGDSLNFNYMFASAEYPTYVCSGFNDVFGFFISGPGISGPFSNGAINIALIPGTTVPVAINTVNSGVPGGAGNAATCAAQDPNWTANNIYYTTLYANYSGQGYNGGTVSMPAVAQLQCGQSYHIKLAVSNVGDQALNSGVYLEGNSFSSNAVNIDVNTVAGDTVIYEGCTDANFIFSRPGDLSDTLIVNYDIAGTATSGTDYNPLINPVVFLPGVDTVIITLTPLLDGLVEPGETVILTAYTISPCGDTLVSQGTLWILDELYLQTPFLDTNFLCPTDSSQIFASVSGGIAPYSYIWTGNSSTTNGAWVNTNSVGTVDYYFTATDLCGYTIDDTISVTVLPNSIIIDSLTATPSTGCAVDGAVAVYTSGATPTQDYVWTSPQPNVPSTVTTSSWNGLLPGWYYVTITEGNCVLDDSIQVTQLPSPLSIDSLVPTLSSPCYDNGAVQAYVSGANGAQQYSWTSPQPNTPASATTATWNGLIPGWYYCTVTYGTCTETDSVLVGTLPQTLQVSSVTSQPTSSCINNGSVSATVSGAVSPTYLWLSTAVNTPSSVTTLNWNNVAGGWYYFQVTDGTCTAVDSIQVTVNPAPIASASGTNISGCIPLQATFTNSSQNATSYQWDFGNSNVVNVNNLSSQTQTFTTSTTVMLIAFDANNCSDTTYVNVDVIPCGCTDPNALNYNPLAVIDNGSCIYPTPTVVCPNIFTPNGDNFNDVFFLDVTNAVKVEFTIVNRWGNLIYEVSESGTNPNPKWNGEARDGKLVNEGTYFVKYTVTGIDGTEVSGQNFVQVVSE